MGKLRIRIKKAIPIVIIGLLLVGCQEKKHILPGDDDINPGELVVGKEGDEETEDEGKQEEVEEGQFE